MQLGATQVHLCRQAVNGEECLTLWIPAAIGELLVESMLEADFNHVTCDVTHEVSVPADPICDLRIFSMYTDGQHGPADQNRCNGHGRCGA